MRAGVRVYVCMGVCVSMCDDVYVRVLFVWLTYHSLTHCFAVDIDRETDPLGNRIECFASASASCCCCWHVRGPVALKLILYVYPHTHINITHTQTRITHTVTFRLTSFVTANVACSPTWTGTSAALLHLSLYSTCILHTFGLSSKCL